MDKDGYNNSVLRTGMHAGTHVDVPRHMLDDDRHISDYPLESFAGRGCLLDVRGEVLIRWKPDYKEQVQEGDIVVFYTGFDRRFGDKGYFTDHPVLERELAEFLVERNVRAVGMDLPSPDRPPFEVHKLLFRAGIPIIENLTNLQALAEVESFELFAFPLKIRAEASPVRVVASCPA
jgi:kynurenine formamidase